VEVSVDKFGFPICFVEVNLPVNYQLLLLSAAKNHLISEKLNFSFIDVSNCPNEKFQRKSFTHFSRPHRLNEMLFL